MDFYHPSGNNTFVPIELLEQVLDNLFQSYHDEGTSARSRHPQQSTIAAANRVCKLWHVLTVEQMYTSITLKSSYWTPHKAMLILQNMGDEEELECCDLSEIRVSPLIVSELLATMRSNERLASMVTELSFESTLGSTLMEKEACDQARILALCPRVRNVHIRYQSRPGIGAWELLDALEHNTLAEMRSLTVRTGSGQSICDMVYFSRLLARWPQLRELEIYCVLNSPTASSNVVSPPSIAETEKGKGKQSERSQPRISTLERLCMSREQSCTTAEMHAYDLAGLLRICPGPGLRSVELSVSRDPDTTFNVGKCVGMWAPTLESLHIYWLEDSRPILPDAIPPLVTADSDVVIREMFVILGEMRKLKSLRFVGQAPPLNSLVHLRSVEEIEVDIDSVTASELHEILQSGRKLSALQKLNVCLIDLTEPYKLRSICESRGIKFHVGHF